jgi:hypothetical protein
MTLTGVTSFFVPELLASVAGEKIIKLRYYLGWPNLKVCP